jgi:hypothetical protein
VDTGLGEPASDHVDGGAKLAGELCEAGVVLAARHEVAVKIGEPEGVGAVIEAPLLAVGNSEAAVEDQAAWQMGGWGCFPCARGAGSPTAPRDFRR